ncbi:MAG TPA: WhiB family transcriptional regulator [Candidatus Saccharimonadales bacterium]|nr:WhiB family transcriptional regulator [Candidatus Saccharimonadales bacterium]
MNAENYQEKSNEPSVAWDKRGLCGQTDPEAFFPEKGGSTKDAKKICAKCDVRVQCLEYALETDQKFGIWGGLSERERKALRRKMAGTGMGRIAANLNQNTLY